MANGLDWSPLRRVVAVSLLVAGLASANHALADKPAALSAQTLKAPNGAASLKGLGESFSANETTGTGSYVVPIALPPGLSTPSVSLRYAGGAGNGEVGLGFGLPVLQIYRTTDKGSPRFDESDRFAVRGSEYNDELVPVNPALGWFRLKNEGAFLLFQRDATNDRWTVLLPNGTRAAMGETLASKAQAAGKTTRWYVESTTDVNGHVVRYRYWKDAGKVYWKGVDYQQEAAAAYQNHVEMSYELRSDVLRDYRYGDEELTAYRLKAIDVSQGARRLKRYTLSYRDGSLDSLLTTVQAEGENGLSLPTLTLGYLSESRHSGRYVRTEGFRSLAGLTSGRMTLEDVNGDGLPDLLDGSSSNYQYFENMDGVRFANVPVSLGVPGSPDRNLDDPGVVLADVDGDGYRDVWYANQSGQLRYFPGGNIKDGKFLGFGAVKVMNANALVSDVTRAEFRLTDLNSDGRTDLLQQRPGISDVWIENQDAKQLVQHAMPTLPSGVSFTDPALELVDFNGDGVLDLVVKEFNDGKHDLRVWYGLGAGKYWNTARVWDAPIAAPREIYLSDVNRDGQTDLVRVSGSWVSYYLNDGRGSFGVESGSFRGMPETSTTKKILFADMNGNGTADIVWLTSDLGMSYLDLMGEPYAGLLSSIDNGMGFVVDISYRSSTDYMVDAKLRGARWKTTAPHAVPVIAEVSSRDSLELLNAESWESRTSYDYRDGYFDAKEREFRGFALVTVTDWGDSWQETRIREINAHVGRNLTTLADEETLKGKVWLQVVKSGDGSVLSSEEVKWEQRWLCREDLGAGGAAVLPLCSGVADKSASKDQMVALGVSVGALQGSWERQSSARYTASKTDYDAWGQASRVESYGEVSVPGGHQVGQPWAFSDLVTGIGDDESVNEIDHAYRAEPGAGTWLIGFTTAQRLKSGSGTTLANSRTYYDGAAFTGLPLGQLSKGLVTRKESWLAEESRWVQEQRTSYNADGLPTEQLDATNGKSALEYDPLTRLYPLVERRQIAASTEMLVSASYDRGYGVITTLTDANAETTEYRYDGLGRLSTVIDPKGSEAEPLITYQYRYATKESPISVTTVRQLVTRGQGVYRTSYDFSDALGRPRLHKERAGQGFVASGFKTFTSNGESKQDYQPFASSNNAFEAPPIGVPRTETLRDAIGRVLEEQLPVTDQQGASVVVRQYLPFETRVFDERDSTEGTLTFPVSTRFDGMRRVREVERKNQVGVNLTTLKWKFNYDARGLVRGFSDPKSGARSYGYDGLGRLTNVNDPNMGSVSFGYDDEGRIARRTDALGQEQRVEYDIAGRVNHEQMSKPDAQGTLHVDTEYTYHYDEAAPSSPLSSPTHLVGRASWVEYPTGAEFFSYDERGDAERTAVSLWDGTSSFAAQQRTTFIRSKAFDASGNEQSTTLPGGVALASEYDSRGLLQRLSLSHAGTTRDVISHAAYDARGGLVSADRANGTRNCRSYDARGMLVGLVVGKQSDVSCGADDFSNIALGMYHVAPQWSYDGLLGGIEDRSAPGGRASRLTAAYQYDRLHQLTSASSGGTSYGYTYDDIQNLTAARTQKAGQPIVEELRSYGESAGPSALTHKGSLALAYDANGQLKAYNGFDLEFDVEGRLARATKPGKRIEYYYDAAGQRKLLIVTEGTSKRVFRYPFEEYEERQGDKLYHVRGGELSVEYHTAPGLSIDAALLEELSSYVNAPAGKPKPLPQEWLDLDGDGDGFDSGDLSEAQQAFWQSRLAGTARSDYRYVETDHLRSAVLATDSTGTDVSARRYTPYGELAQRSGVQPATGFAATDVEPDDDLGLVLMGARYYAPALARWVTPDRFIGDAPSLSTRRPLESNLYSYASNNPITLADPSGGIAQWIVGAALGIAFDAALQGIDIALDDKKTYHDFSWGSLVVSGVTGGVGVGLAGKIGKIGSLISNGAVRKAVSIGLGMATDAVMSVTSNFAKKKLFNVGDGVTLKGTVLDVVGSLVGTAAIKWVGSKLVGSKALQLLLRSAEHDGNEAIKGLSKARGPVEHAAQVDKFLSALDEQRAVQEKIGQSMDKFGLSGSGMGQTMTNGGSSVYNWAKKKGITLSPGEPRRDELSGPKASPSASVGISF